MHRIKVSGRTRCKSMFDISTFEAWRKCHMNNIVDNLIVTKLKRVIMALRNISRKLPDNINKIHKIALVQVVLTQLCCFLSVPKINVTLNNWFVPMFCSFLQSIEWNLVNNKRRLDSKRGPISIKLNVIILDRQINCPI